MISIFKILGRNMLCENYIILTGAMGAGKSTVIKKLRELNVSCVDEPARQILEEQRLIKGNGVPEADPELFIELMLSRTTYQYKSLARNSGMVFFDRGMPDFIGYADLSNVNNKIYYNASKEYRFNKHVFLFSGWESIYTTDEERKMNFDLANEFGKKIKLIYENCGYITIDVPFGETADRIEFILNKIKDYKIFG
ncbi:MAG: AAA family ATPase [Ignavibacteria bacterium]